MFYIYIYNIYVNPKNGMYTLAQDSMPMKIQSVLHAYNLIYNVNPTF